LDENLSAARYFNLLWRYSGKAEYQAGAETAMRYLTTPDVAKQNLTEAGILLADDESRNPPTHITVIGMKEDPQAQDLFRAAMRTPMAYIRTEWWDRREGPMPNADVQYPDLKRSAAFICSQGLCSSPVFEPEGIAFRLKVLETKLSSGK